MTAPVTLPVETVLRWGGEAFTRAGMTSEHAAVATDVLVRTSLRGVDTHGISRIPPYVDALLDGISTPQPRLECTVNNGVSHYEGERGIGQVVGTIAMAATIQRARSTPLSMSLIRRSGHMGALGAYALMAAEQGMIGIVGQATTPLMALPGFKGRAIGNNPFAFAAPVPGREPLVFDAALSRISRTRLREAIRDGEPIPEGVAIDPDGHPTTDPQASWDGAMLPVGDHKGIGIAMLIQVLGGSLAGSAPDLLSGGDPLANLSAFILVINPALSGASSFDADMTAWLRNYTAAGGGEGRYPGQRGAHLERERRARGIPVPPVLRAQFAATAARLGMDPILPD